MLNALNNPTIIFSGDSITDTERRGEHSPFGWGYVNIVRNMIINKYPEKNITFLNKGIGGDTIIDLKNRWRDDIIYNKPDLLTILIGINDIHHFISEGDREMDVNNFRKNYDYILSETKTAANVRIILIDPFYISTDKKGDSLRSVILNILPEYINVVHDMAKKHHTLLLRTHDIFQNHLRYRESEFFAPEPVHPNISGHIIIANELFRLIEE